MGAKWNTTIIFPVSEESKEQFDIENDVSFIL